MLNMDFHYYLNRFGGVTGLITFASSFLKSVLSFAVAYLFHRLQLVNTQETVLIALLLHPIVSGFFAYLQVPDPTTTPSSSFDGTLTTGQII